MSVVTLIRAWPRNIATGAIALTLLAGGSDGQPYPAGYRAGVIAEPRFEASISFTDDGWGGRCVPQVGAIAWMPADPTRLDALAAYYWRGASIEIDRVVNGAATRRLTGTVADATIGEGRLVITCADLASKLDAPVTAATFAGTGGIEGGDFATGRAKRRSFGLVWNVEGRLLDKAYNIYEFGDPAFPLQGCSALRDKGRAGPVGIVQWQGSISATLDALRAAQPQAGGGVFAPSIACAKWWTQPVGPLTADLMGQAAGYAQTAAGVAAQLLAAAGGPAISDAGPARPAALGLHIGDNNETTAAALDRLLQRLALGWRLNAAGTVEIWDYRFAGPTEALQAIFISRESTLQPVKSRKVGYRKNERVHGDGEISAAVRADDVTYADGTTAEDRKPAEPGATNSANPASPLGDKTVGEVLADAEINTEAILAQALRQDDFAQVMGAAAFVEGQPVSTSFLNFRNDQTGVNSALASTLALIGAKNADGTAFVMNLETARVTSTQTLAQKLTELGAIGTMDDGSTVKATVQFLNDVFIGDGQNYAKAILRADANGTFGAFTITADGVTRRSNMAFVADEVYFVDPNGGHATRPLIYVGAQGGEPARWEFSADIYAKRIVADVIETKNIKPNQVTGATFYQKSWSGIDVSQIGPTSTGYWATFGGPDPAQVTPQGGTVPQGTDVTLRFYVNMQRTGSNNDRVWFRLRRESAGTGASYIGDIMRTGMSDYPTVAPWEWYDKVPITDQYLYTIEIYRDEGGGRYFSAKLICVIGKR